MYIQLILNCHNLIMIFVNDPINIISQPLQLQSNNTKIYY